jgi:transcriptional regulator with XRE-family HTH domain
MKKIRVGVEQIKAAKLLGKRLRKVREKQRFNIATLASKLNFTVVELVAIEDGNLYVFDDSLEKLSESADLYAQEIGLDLSDKPNSTKESKLVVAEECDSLVPYFLRKK